MKVKLVDCLAVGGAFIGSALMAANLGIAAIIVAYFLFLESAIAGAYILYTRDGPKSLLIINLYYVLINIIGIVRYSFY